MAEGRVEHPLKGHSLTGHPIVVPSRGSCFSAKHGCSQSTWEPTCSRSSLCSVPKLFSIVFKTDSWLLSSCTCCRERFWCLKKTNARITKEPAKIANAISFMVELDAFLFRNYGYRSYPSWTPNRTTSKALSWIFWRWTELFIFNTSTKKDEFWSAILKKRRYKFLRSKDVPRQRNSRAFCIE